MMTPTDLRSPRDTTVDDQWPLLLKFLPKGWQDAAWTQGAIQRLRVIESAEALLRLILMYAWNDWSLRVKDNLNWLLSTFGAGCVG